MKTKSKAFLLTSALLVAGTVTAYAATSVDYYGFTGMNNTTVYTQDAFTVTNSSGVIIKGWQDDYTPTYPADITYQVVHDSFFGWTNYGTPKRFYGNYPQNGTWYGHTFTNIPLGSDYHIKLTVNSSYRTDGAGNVYQ